MNITSSNTSGYRLISDTADYTTTLTAGDGYILPEAVTVTAGGTALTSGMDYTYNSGTGVLTIPASKITGDIVITAAGVAKSYTIELSTTPATNPPELSFSGTYGYTATDVAAQTVTVENTGNQSVTLTQPTASNFTVTLQTGGSLTLAPGGTAVFEVTPKSGLSATTHSETITINGTDNTSASFTASFEVAPKTLTVDVEIADKQYDGKTDATIMDAALVGVVGSDAVALADYSGITAAFDRTAVEDAIPVTLTGSFTLTGTDAGNYTLTQPSGVTGNIVNNFTGKGCYTTTQLNADGWTNAEFFDIVANDGYKLSTTNTDLNAERWDNSISFSNESAGTEVTFYVMNTKTGAISLPVKESYKIDNTSPEAEIKVEANSFKQFVNTITFGLFFKENVDVTITGSDTLSGVAKIEYQKVSSEAEYDENGTWTEYAAFSVEQDEEFIVYARITDKAGNQTLIRSDGVVVDKTDPVISGIDDGDYYYGDKTFTFSDKYLDMVVVDGVPIDIASGSHTITADNNVHTIIVTDKASNDITVTITVYKQYAVTLTAGTGYTLTAQTGSASPVDHGGIYSFTLTLDDDYETGADFAVKVNGTVLTAEGGVYTIENITADITVTVDGVVLKGADYSEVDKAIAAANALNPDEYTNFSAVTAAIDAVERGMDITKQDEVDAMAKAINDAIEALVYKTADYTEVDRAIAAAQTLDADNYTDFSKVTKAVEDVDRTKNITEQDEVDAMAKAINDAIDALIYKGANYDAVTAAILRANALNPDDYISFDAVSGAVGSVVNGKNITEQSEVDAMARAINDAIEALTAKPSDNPQTGDNSNLLLWFALLFVSGGAVVTLTVYGRKRRANR